MIALGVPTSYFQKLYNDQIEDIFSLGSSAERAIEILQRELSYKDEEDKNEQTLTQSLLACLLANNFKDPQVLSHTQVLTKQVQKNIAIIQKQMLESLRDKGQIFMEQSFNLIGVPDNTGTLEYGQVYVNVKNK